MPQKRLQRVILNSNRIASCERFTGHPTLTVLELKKNRLESCKGIGHLTALTELYLD